MGASPPDPHSLRRKIAAGRFGGKSGGKLQKILRKIAHSLRRKIAQRLGASPRDPHSLRRLGAHPQTLVCDTFELQYISLLKQVSQFRQFRILAIGLSPLLERVPCYGPTPGHGF